FVIGCRLCGLLDGNHLSWLLGLRDDKADSRWRQPVRQGGKKEESDFCEPMEGRLVGRQKHISAGLDPRMGFEAWPWCPADHYRGADAPARQELGEHERLREAAGIRRHEPERPCHRPSEQPRVRFATSRPLGRTAEATYDRLDVGTPQASADEDVGPQNL